MYAIVATIDAFDEGAPGGGGGFQNPAVVAPGLLKARSGLFSNYAANNPRLVDKRIAGIPPNRQRYAAFSSEPAGGGPAIVEKYQHLLLHTAPLWNGVGAPSAGYADRQQKAVDRFNAWTQSFGTIASTVPALELLNVDWHDTGLAVRPLRLGPAAAGNPPVRRFRLDITPFGANADVTYGNIPGRPRYLYLQPGSPVVGGHNNPVPIHMRPSLQVHVALNISVTPAEITQGNRPQFAIGCTCRDFLFNAQTPTGLPGPAFYGCKHMLFYNYCRAQETAGGYGAYNVFNEPP